MWNDSFTRVTQHIHICDMTYSCVSFSYMCHPCVGSAPSRQEVERRCRAFPFFCVHMRDMTHSYVWHDLFLTWYASFIFRTWRIRIYVTWLIYICDSLICVQWPIQCEIWLIHVHNMAHSLYVTWWHDSSVDVTRSYMWHDSFRYRFRFLDMIHSRVDLHVWHDSFTCMLICVTRSYCVTWRLIYACDLTYSYVWPNSFIHMNRHVHIYVT